MVEQLAIIGILGGILCSAADCLVDLKGADNHSIGKRKVIESNWEKISQTRLLWSVILAAIAVPMYSCGFLSLMICLFERNQTAALVVGGIFFFGAMGGVMIHTMVCLAPTIYKILLKTSPFEVIEDVIEGVWKLIRFPFILLYVSICMIPSISVMVFIANGTLPLPMWCMTLNPLVFQIISLLLRATKCKLFVDVPGIFAASLGVGMYGALALMLL